MSDRLDKLHDKLTDRFIIYQWRLDNPFPQANETLNLMLARYRSDPMFHAKVATLVAGVIGIVIEWRKEND